MIASSGKHSPDLCSTTSSTAPDTTRNISLDDSASWQRNCAEGVRVCVRTGRGGEFHGMRGASFMECEGR
eukprot:106600-Rhodomonas_salina.2